MIGPFVAIKERVIAATSTHSRSICDHELYNEEMRDVRQCHDQPEDTGNLPILRRRAGTIVSLSSSTGEEDEPYPRHGRLG